MSKRAHDYMDSRPPKRPKPSPPTQPQAPEEIHFARQLQELLTFRQDGISQLRAGIASFKAFLESILYHKNDDDRGRQLGILREYLEAQKPDDPTDIERPFLGHLWQAWSFASTGNNDYLVSSITAVITLLLKTLSSLLDFRDYGLLLGRTVLQSTHLRLVKRSLDASRHKDFLISPALRLLIEVTGFDGGVLAREVYKRREQTFDPMTLRRLLGFTKSDQSDEDAKRRPAVRTIAVRYILAHLKYLREGGKTDILKSRPLCTSLFHFLREDPTDVVLEILSAVEQYVLKDDELPRSAKANVLVQHNLERVTEVVTRSEEDSAIAKAAFAFLKAVCTKPSYGILRASGWYPPGTTSVDRPSQDDRSIDLGLDNIDFYDNGDKVNVRNTILLSYIQTLRPHASLQERELVITCFKAAPELVAAYFTEKQMQLDPKLSNTWIGYASFLFEVVQLDVPEYFGQGDAWVQLPPQTDVMLESILPQPMTQKVLARCLNQNSDLIAFFAVRILVIALTKLSKVSALLADGAKSEGVRSNLWEEAADRLKAGFVNRCPLIKDVIATFRKLTDDEGHALQQEAITRLLRLYYEILPLQALEQQFDISTALNLALVQGQETETESEIAQLQALRLSHLLQIAKHSPGMKWFSKHGSLEVSPFTTLLQIHCRHVMDKETRGLIYHVMKENSVCNQAQECDALIALLHDRHRGSSVVGSFLDDCFARISRHPVKYLDILDDVHISCRSGRHVIHASTFRPPLLSAACLEQAPFINKRPSKEKEELHAFVSAYMELLIHVHVDLVAGTSDLCVGLMEIHERLIMNQHFPKDVVSSVQQDIMDKVRFVQQPDTESQAVQHAVNAERQAAELAIPFPPPPLEPEDHPQLLKWSQKDLGLSFEDGDVASLILCLSSQYQEVRSQALTQLYKLEDRVLNSNIDDRDPIYVLLGELIETYERHRQSTDAALPYNTAYFATHALEVQMQPIHYLYPKINKFLNKGPTWRSNRLPAYWIENTVLSQPEEDDAYWKEVQWVLQWLVDSLRSPADLEILRKASIFEKVMSLHASPGAGKTVKEKVLELIWRATWIEGGSMTLVTRAGVLDWLQMVAIDSSSPSLAHTMMKRVLETCDKARLAEWGGVPVRSDLATVM